MQTSSFQENDSFCRQKTESEKFIEKQVADSIIKGTANQEKQSVEAHWSIPEIAWFEAMMGTCTNENSTAVTNEEVHTVLDTSHNEAVVYEEKDKSSILCHGQGDGLDSPVYFCTPPSSFESFDHSKQIRHDYNPIIPNSFEEKPRIQNNSTPVVFDSSNCLNYQTPNRFDPSMTLGYGNDKTHYSNGHQNKYPHSQNPYGFCPYRPSRGRRGGCYRQNFKWPTNHSNILKPPHITKLRNSNSSSDPTSSSSNYVTTSESDAASPFSSLTSNNSTFDSNEKSYIDCDQSPIYPKVPNNTPDSANASFTSSCNSTPYNREEIIKQCGINPNQLTSKLQLWTNFAGSDMRESHNAKERHRRSRIRDACNLLRNYVPSINERTDNATVFEVALEYMNFLQEISQRRFDDEFARRRFEAKKCE